MSVDMTRDQGAGTDSFQILIVGDSPNDTSKVRRLLEQGLGRQCQFTEASTGLDVEAALDPIAGPPRCLVLSAQLHDDGVLQFLGGLTRPDGLTVCPVVVLTAGVTSDDARALLRAGAQDFVSKADITPNTLMRAVENALERWAMADELRRRELALALSEARLRLAVEATATGLWTWDLVTDAVTWSAECYRIHGIADGAFGGTGAAFFKLVHPEDQARVEATVRRAIGSGDLYACDFRIVRPDGNTTWVSNRGRCTYDSAGRPLQVLGTIIDVSERHRAEEQLQRNHQTFAHLIDDNPFGVYVVDADFRLQRVSQGAQKVFAGIRPLLGRDFAEIIRVIWPEPFASEVIERFHHTLATGERYAAPSTVERRADIGDEEAYDWRIERVALPDGRNGVICYFYDLSERKRLEAVLVAKEQELRSMTDTTPDILSRFDRSLRHVFVNAAVERATGRPRQEFLGKTNRELGMPPALCDQWESATRQVFDTGKRMLIDFAFESANGPTYYTAHLMPEFSQTGEVEFVLGVTHDVTEQRRATDAMSASEERLRLALSAAQAGAWEWDIANGTIAWSVENYDLYGMDPAAGPPTYELWEARLHPDDVGPTNEAVRATLAGTMPEYRAEFRVRHPDRGQRWLLGIGRVAFGPSGEPLRMVGINLDISERKQYEQTLAEADQRKDEFLATLAHELRNPLAPIRTGLEILRIAPTGDHAPNIIAMMDRQLSHLVRLVDDLLDVSRVRSGKITLRIEQLTLQDIVEAAVEASLPAVKEKSHQLQLDLDAQPLTVSGDRTRLVQVVVNLLTNAAKYMEPGGRICVTMRAVKGEASIRVSDTGVGIAEAQLPTLWDLFTQVRDTLDKAQGGLGIGLSLVRRLVEMHGGMVAAESDGIGKGSAFTVRLPLSAPEYPASGAQ